MSLISFAPEDLDEVNLLRAKAVSENNDWEFNDRSLQGPFEGEKATRYTRKDRAGIGYPGVRIS